MFDPLVTHPGFFAVFSYYMSLENQIYGCSDR